MTNRIKTIRAKLVRAEEHVDSVKRLVTAFSESNPYAVELTSRDAEDKPVFTTTRVDDAPEALPIIVGDAIHGLRSSLDHLACRLVEANGGASGTQTYFVIGKDEKSFAVDSVRKLAGISRPALNAIEALAPYLGGNDALWKLHQLDIIDKHRALITVASAMEAVDVSALMRHVMTTNVPLHRPPDWTAAIDAEMRQARIFLRVQDPLCPLKVGDVLFIGAPGQNADGQRFKVSVALHEPGVAEAAPLVELLDELTSATKAVVSALEPFL